MSSNQTTWSFIEGPNTNPTAADMSGSPWTLVDNGPGKNKSVIPAAPYTINGAAGNVYLGPSDLNNTELTGIGAGILNVSGPTAAFTAYVPATTFSQAWMVVNSTAYAMTLQATTGTTLAAAPGGATGLPVVIAAGSSASVSWNGTNLVKTPMGNGTAFVTVTTANITLTADQSAASCIELDGTPAAGHTITLTTPDTNPKVFANTTGQIMTISGPSGATVAIAASHTAILRWNGTNILRVTADT